MRRKEVEPDRTIRDGCVVWHEPTAREWIVLSTLEWMSCGEYLLERDPRAWIRPSNSPEYIVASEADCYWRAE